MHDAAVNHDQPIKTKHDPVGSPIQDAKPYVKTGFLPTGSLRLQHASGFERTPMQAWEVYALTKDRTQREMQWSVLASACSATPDISSYLR